MKQVWIIYYFHNELLHAAEDIQLEARIPPRI